VRHQQTNWLFPHVGRPLLQLCSHTLEEASFFNEFVKQAPSLDELRGRVEFGDRTTVEDDDPVGIQDGIYTMCDSYDGPVAENIAT
jgi:hypothetical protein